MHKAPVRRDLWLKWWTLRTHIRWSSLTCAFDHFPACDLVNTEIDVLPVCRAHAFVEEVQA